LASHGSKGRDGRYAAMPRPHDPAYNRDDEQKPRTPRSASEPHGAEGSARTSKTMTDPASGEHRRDGHAPNQAETDQHEGAGGRRAAAKQKLTPD
jgi:hypothetical protein